MFSFLSLPPSVCVGVGRERGLISKASLCVAIKHHFPDILWQLEAVLYTLRPSSLPIHLLPASFLYPEYTSNPHRAAVISILLLYIIYIRKAGPRKPRLWEKKLCMLKKLTPPPPPSSCFLRCDIVRIAHSCDFGAPAGFKKGSVTGVTRV